MYIFSNNILTVLHIHTISYLDFNKYVQFFANVDSKCCHRGLKCFSAQVMKIKEDLIAQEPKHREAMEEVWNDMMVGNISKCFALTFPYLHSFITMAIEKDGKHLAAHLPFAINKKGTNSHLAISWEFELVPPSPLTTWQLTTLLIAKRQHFTTKNLCLT